MNPREWLSNEFSRLAADICRGTQPLEKKADADAIKSRVGELIDQVKQMFEEEEPE